MSITSETFYRAECEECHRTVPDYDDHEASHWPLAAVEEYLREKHGHGVGDVEVQWFYDGSKTLCPEHHPEARPCGTCDGQGYVRVEGPPPNLREGVDWSLPHHWKECPECHWVGFHPAPTAQTDGGQ